MNFSSPRSSYSQNIVSSMEMNLAKNPDLPAIITPERQETWSQMWGRTGRLAKGLAHLGLAKGDRVALFLPNGFEFSEAFIATTRGGFVKTPVNFNFKAEELAYQLNDCGASALITHADLLPVVDAARPRVPGLRQVVVAGSDKAPAHTVDYEALIADTPDGELDVAISPDDIHMILYTSGTTGQPKGAVRGYSEDYHTGITVCVEWQVRSGDVQLAVAPQYHAGPCAWFLATLVSGGTLSVQESFHPVHLLEAVTRDRVNWMMMVPIMFDRLMSMGAKTLGKFDLSSLRTMISGGAPLHTATKLAIKACLPNVELNEFYGSTELGVSTTLRDVDQLRKKRCVGKPLQDLEVRLLDKENRPVATGEIGLLYSRGLGGFRGYWNNEDATSEAFLGQEWATVGDLARQDEEGYYYIVDRAKDMIITGGVNVYPAEIEDVLKGLSGVADVGVIGVPHKEWGEAVKAVIVKAPDAELDEAAVLDFAREKMARFKVPKDVDFVEALPRNPSGKLLKNVLRESHWTHRDIKVN